MFHKRHNECDKTYDYFFVRTHLSVWAPLSREDSLKMKKDLIFKRHGIRKETEIPNGITVYYLCEFLPGKKPFAFPF